MSAYRFGEYRLDLDTRTLIGDGRETGLSTKHFEILRCLARASGSTVTKDDLIAEVWHDVETSDATIVQHIATLRRLLNEGARSHRYILTVHGVGYRLAPPAYFERYRGPHDSVTDDPSRCDDSVVWREYLAAGRYCEKRDRASLLRAVEHFNSAAERNTAFGPAWIGIARANLLMLFYGFTATRDALVSAEPALSKAFELDASSSLAYCVRAQAQMANWDIDAAYRSLERAERLAPQSASVHQTRALVSSWLGESAEAVADARRAIAVEPGNSLLHLVLASALSVRGSLTEAIAGFSKVLDEEPAWKLALEGRSEAHLGAGRPDLALLDLDRLPNTPANAGRRACAQAVAGDRSGAAQLVATLRRRAAKEFVPLHVMVRAYAVLGEANEAVRLAGRAVATKDFMFPTMESCPVFLDGVKDSALRRLLSEVKHRIRSSHRRVS